MEVNKIVRAQERPLGVDLIRIDYRGREMIVAPNRLSLTDIMKYSPDENIRPRIEFSGDEVYYHSEELPRCTFRAALTHESIAIARSLGGFGLLELGDGYATPDGIFVNIDEVGVLKRFGISPEDRFPSRNVVPSRDFWKARGEFYTTRVRDNLLKMIDKAQELKGIYFIDDIVFAPYETYKNGWQNSKEFCTSGLARSLEHTENDVAEDIKFFTSQQEHFPEGVFVDVPGIRISEGELATSIKIAIRTRIDTEKEGEYKSNRKAFGLVAPSNYLYYPTIYGILNS